MLASNCCIVLTHIGMHGEPQETVTDLVKGTLQSYNNSPKREGRDRNLRSFSVVMQVRQVHPDSHCTYTDYLGSTNGGVCFRLGLSAPRKARQSSTTQGWLSRDARGQGLE